MREEEGRIGKKNRQIMREYEIILSLLLSYLQLSSFLSSTHQKDFQPPIRERLGERGEEEERKERRRGGG
jgi:hypothetical protein